MAHILGIGIATVDIINTVDGYPPEDAEVRAVAQRVARGGNVANTLVVLSQLGHDCFWGGVLADEPDAERIVTDLRGYDVDLSGCRHVDHGKMPVSYVTVNARNGSRTIIHYRDLPEFGADDFAAIELGSADWVHFEGRNVAATARMLEHARGRYTKAVISLEVEKPRPGIEHLFGGADLLLFSHGYAQARGYNEPCPFLESIREHTPGADLVCAWGEGGAYSLDRAGSWSDTQAFVPAAVIDTLGAGDTFNAAVIDGRLRGLDWPRTLSAAARLAGRKCGQIGFSGLGRGDD